jgi:5-enolpyruvylshikimate-3-phosphate synthase
VLTWFRIASDHRIAMALAVGALQAKEILSLTKQVLLTNHILHFTNTWKQWVPASF